MKAELVELSDLVCVYWG